MVQPQAAAMGVPDTVPAWVPTAAWIGGEPRPTTGSFEVLDPATGARVATVGDASPADATDALTAAVAAGAGWARTAPRARSELLRRAYELLLERRDDLARLITLEGGKPLAESHAEVDYAAAFVRWYAEEAVRIDGRSTAAEGGDHHLLTVRAPVGPCLLVTPWNFPLAMGTRKVAPALAAGCPCVVKPAEQTPLSMLALAAIFADAGLPAGVLNVVATTDAVALVATLMRDPRLRKLSFTGSTAVGQALIRQSADQVLRLSMELGGNAPFVVFDDADLDLAVDAAMVAKLRNGGQACTAANRFLVQAAVAEPFTRRLTDRMDRLVMGHGLTPGVTLGPMIDGRQRDRVAGLVDDALASGGELRCGGDAPGGPGSFFPGTLIAGVAPTARAVREEIFGPLAIVQSFATDDDAYAMANATESGLAAYVFSASQRRCQAAVERLDVGLLGINRGIVSNAGAPFGGVKHSGYGREGGPEGLAEYLELRHVAVGG